MSACGACGGKPFHTRAYSGETLCSGCFRDSIVDKARRTMSRYSMVRRGDRVAVAVSGGKDSLSLLRVLDHLKEAGGFELVAVSIDEGVKGYRDEAIQNAAKATGSLRIEHLTLSYKELFGFSLDEALDWKGEREVASCSFCGVFRRRAIDEAAAKVGADVVATGHNLDDFVQTFVMNLMHGDLSRMAWMDPAYADRTFPVRRVKPFMEVYEQELALYAFDAGLPFQSVSCPYMHEGLRSEVRDYLNQMESSHPGMKNVMLRSALDVISRYSAPAGRGPVPCEVCGKPSGSGLCGVCRMEATVRQHINHSD